MESQITEVQFYGDPDARWSLHTIRTSLHYIVAQNLRDIGIERLYDTILVAQSANLRLAIYDARLGTLKFVSHPINSASSFRDLEIILDRQSTLKPEDVIFLTEW